MAVLNRTSLLLLLVVANMASAQEGSSVPAEVLRSWGYLVGDWEIDGQVGDREVIGQATFEWADGKHCYLGRQVWEVGADERIIKLTLIGGWDAENKEAVEQGFSTTGGSATVRYQPASTVRDVRQVQGTTKGYELRGGQWNGDVKIQRKGADEYSLTTTVDGKELHRLTYRRVKLTR